MSAIVCTVRYVKRVARKDEAAKTMIKRQELQIRRMREAWMLEWDEITLLKQIGQGVAGEVWKGCMNETNWDVAVKIILGSEDIETGDDAEISFLRQCRHPRLVMFLGCGRCKSNDDIFLVLEMMECSVDTVLWREKANQATGNQVRYIRLLQDWSVRLRLISHIAAGMEYLHIEHEAIHRDLKTPNVLISFDKTRIDRCKNFDFGLARVFESQMGPRKEERKRQLSSSNDKVKRFISAEMTVRGNTLWMAPELAVMTQRSCTRRLLMCTYIRGRSASLSFILRLLIALIRHSYNYHTLTHNNATRILRSKTGTHLESFWSSERADRIPMSTFNSRASLDFVAKGGRPKYVSKDMPRIMSH